MEDSGLNYERFLRDILQDFEDRVFAVQKKAEESIRAYENCCGELKGQLEQMKLENESLKGKVKNGDATNHRALELLSAMTSLSVCCDYNSEDLQRYSCNVEDGLLKGHSFILTLDLHAKEYTYNPALRQNLIENDFLAKKIVFPEHLLCSFLINLITQNCNFS